MATDGSVAIRAAYDLGSGRLKLQVAEMDLREKRILRILVEEERRCLLRQAMAMRSDGAMGAEILETCFGMLREFRQAAESAGAQHHAAVATAVFRDAADGGAFLERVRLELGLEAKIVSQELEGELGYLTAQALAAQTGTSLTDRQLLAWDSGGGSFQVSARAPDGGLQVWGGDIGSAGATKAMVEDVQGCSFGKEKNQRSTPNPCAPEQLKSLSALLRARIGEPPAWLSERHAGVENEVIIAFCCSGGAFEQCEQAVANGSAEFTADELWQALERLAGQTDPQLEAQGYAQPHMVLTKMVLVHSVMTLANFAKVKHVYAAGTCTGMLLCDVLWK